MTEQLSLTRSLIVYSNFFNYCLFLFQDPMQVTVRHLAAMSFQSPVCCDISSLSLYLVPLIVLRRPLSEVKVAQPRLTLCDPMDYTVHGIL